MEGQICFSKVSLQCGTSQLQGSVALVAIRPVARQLWPVTAATLLGAVSFSKNAKSVATRAPPTDHQGDSQPGIGQPAHHGHHGINEATDDFAE